MNERIKELDRQAVEWALSVVDADGCYRGKEYLDLVKEKLAVLIVQDCLKIFEDDPMNSFHGSVADDYARQRIKKHFGVEE